MINRVEDEQQKTHFRRLTYRLVKRRRTDEYRAIRRALGFLSTCHAVGITVD
jgi:hypothetical protein